jgi:DNA-binding IclR family transcriptional regulator
MHPLRLRILAELRQPASPTEVAARIRAPRQKVHYHVLELARAGFLVRAGRRRKRNMIEQRWVATARGYVLSPQILGSMGIAPEEVEERWSAERLVALAARAQSEMIESLQKAGGKHLATLSINSEIRFQKASQRKAFAAALQEALVRIIAEHTSAGTGRRYRLVVGCYPLPPAKESKK